MIDFSAESVRRELAYVLRYSVSGILNTVLGFAVIYFFMVLGFSPVYSNAAGYALGFVVSFLLSKKFVFRAAGRWSVDALLYAFSFVVAFLCNILTLTVLIDFSLVNPYVAQIFAACVFTGIMFLLGRFFVFARA